MHDPDPRSVLARRDFLKTTGTVVVGFSVASELAAGQTRETTGVPPGRGTVSGPPDDAELDSYIAIHADNTASIFSGYVELGQGGPTALTQIAAEELGLDFHQVAMARMDTFVSTNGSTAASRTAGVGGVQLRAAAAEARRVLLAMASERLQAPVSELAVSKGVVTVKSDPQRSITYGAILGDQPFNRRYEPVAYSGGTELPRKGRDNAPPRPPAEYTIVGRPVRRLDIPEKVVGSYAFVQHVRVPGMLHGRVVWPRGQGAYNVSIPTVLDIDEQSIKDIPGARIVRRRNFVGVAAEREWDAVRAAARLKVAWGAFSPTLPGDAGVHDSFRTGTRNDSVVVNTGDVSAALTRGTHVVSATYRGPYQSHGTMAPNCAVANVTQDGALVMCSDQGIYGTRNTLVRLLGLPIEKVRVQYYAGSNTYGSSCYRDAAEAAAIMSQELGSPVRVQLSRADEFGWDNYGPALLTDVRAAVDADGRIVAFDCEAWGHGSTVALNTTQQLAMGTPPPPVATGFQIRLSQNDMYDIPNRRMIHHRLSSVGYLRSGPLRAPLDPPYFFAQEGIVDELAYLARLDPYDFRKRNISHPRWLRVLEVVTDAAKWTPRLAASNISDAKIATGRGIALGTHHNQAVQGNRMTYAAAVVDVEVNRGNGIVVAKHVYGAMDCGLAVNPGIVESQIVGMAVHGASMALKEEVRFNQTNVTSLDWNSYQTLRFGEHPRVTPIVVQRVAEPSSGAGEEVLPAVVAAIGNAFFDATGVRIRQFPLTPQRVVAALAARR